MLNIYIVAEETQSNTSEHLVSPGSRAQVIFANCYLWMCRYRGMCVCVFIYIHIYREVYIYVQANVFAVYISICSCVYMCMCIGTQVCVPIYIHALLCIHAFIFCVLFMCLCYSKSQNVLIFSAVSTTYYHT